MVGNSQSLVQGLSQGEIAALRALMDGLIIPSIMEGGDFWASLEVMRKGYSTRYLPVGEGGGGLSAPTAKAALDTQVHRGERVRNRDWLSVQSVMGPGLRACTLFWAAFRGGGVRADDFDEVYRLLGLSVGSHRRLAILRGLERDGLLAQDRYRIFRLVGNPDEVIEATCPWWRLFFGLNILSPAVFQRFRQADGAMLATWNLRVLPAEMVEMYSHLPGIVDSHLQCVGRPLRDLRASEREEHVLMATFCGTYHSNRRRSESRAALQLPLLLMGPVADALNKLGPWEVASEIVRRRFVELVSSKTGLDKVDLYRHLAERYGVTSANTVRAFLDAPSLEGVSAGRTFNRGRIYQLSFTIRSVLAELGADAISESILKARVAEREGTSHIDQAVWRAALRGLVEDDVVQASAGSSELQLRQSRDGFQVMAPAVERLEAGAKLLLPRVLMLVQALLADRDSRAEAGLWVVPRSALRGLRERIYGDINEWSRRQTAPNFHLTEEQEEDLGMVPAEFFLTARTMPLLPNLRI